MRYWYLHLLRLLSSDGGPADDHKLDFGFLTALYVPFVPLFQWILFRKRPTPIIAGGILFAFIGMLLILDPTKISLHGSIGEWLTIASAAACAMEILVLGHFANSCEPKGFLFYSACYRHVLEHALLHRI